MGLEINRVKYFPKWNLIRLKDVCSKITDGTHFTPNYTEKGVPFISVKDIYNNSVHFDKCKYISEKEHTELFKRCNPEQGDVLITKSGTIGRMALVPENPQFSLFVSVALIKNKKDIILSKFLMYCLQNFLNSISISNDIKGGVVKNFHLEDIRETLIPSVSIGDQLNIISKLEELFSELDKGIEQLETAQQQLKIYRQSLLKSAFEGKLTHNNIKDGELPTEWTTEVLNHIASVNPKLSNKENIPLSLEVQFVPMKLVEPIVNKIHLSEIRTITEVQKGSYTPFVNGDIIFAKVTPCMENGKIAIASNLKNGIGYGSSEFHVLRCNDKVLNKYLFYYLIQDSIRKQAANSMTGAVGLRRVPKQFLENLNIPLPSISEQILIVQELEDKLSACDKIYDSIDQDLLHAESLRQSILKQAFEGKLVKIKEQKQDVKVILLYKPKNEYFYQLQVLGLIAKASKHNKVPHGEMTLAKYAYLADKLFDVPTFYDYQRWHLGPFPPVIKKVFNNKQYFKKVSGELEVLNEKKLFRSTNPYQQQIENAVTELTSIFSKYEGKERSHKTELLATVCKVVEDIQTADLKAVRASMAEWKIELKGEKHKTKAEKFTEAETKKCLVFLKEKGWDNKLIKDKNG